MDVQWWIAVTGLGAVSVFGVFLLPGFWQGRTAKKMYRNASAFDISPEWLCRLVRSWHLALAWAVSTVAILVSIGFGWFESEPFSPPEIFLMALSGGSVLLALITLFTGRPKLVLPPWARNDSTREFLSGADSN